MVVKQHAEELNGFLVSVFDEILKTEEVCLAETFRDLSLREIHLIAEVCRADDEGRDNRATAIAAARRVTAGTLTTSVSLLEKKGYVQRRRDEKDRRAVRILPTQRGREVDLGHTRFHREMVDEILQLLSEEETRVLAGALSSLSGFFRQKDTG